MSSCNGYVIQFVFLSILIEILKLTAQLFVLLILSDLLVVFTRPSHLHRINAPTDDTPRSLSALSAYLASRVVLPLKGRTASSSPAQYSLVYPVQPGVSLAQSPSGEASVSISSFYHQDRVSTSELLLFCSNLFC